VQFASVIPRWRDGKQTRNILETSGRRQFNALFIETHTKTGLTKSVEHIQRIF